MEARFIPSPQEIEKRIKDLIGREYLTKSIQKTEDG